MSEEQKILRVKSHLSRLAALSLQNFPERGLLKADGFWKAIGNEKPIQDVWGTAYDLESQEGGNRLFWRSAGPDKVLGTMDDIRAQIPYSDGPKISEEDLSNAPSFTSEPAQ